MAVHYWIKLYLEILDDPKMGGLPHWQWRRFIEFCLAAKETNHDGLLQPVPQLAWRLRITEKECEEALRALSAIGVVAETPDGWLVVNFKKRQMALSSTERVQEFRKRERKHYWNADETKRSTEEEEEEEKEEEKEEDARASSPSIFRSFSLPETASAISAFHDQRAQDAEHLYQQITGQICLPPDQAASALETLGNILDYYQGNLKEAAARGKPVFAEWCNRRGKNGRNYSPTNLTWIVKWLERIAPRPQPDTADSLAQRMARDFGVVQ